MKRNIIVSVDGLSDEGRTRIHTVAARAGAYVSFLPEATSWDAHLSGVEIAFGNLPPELVANSGLRFLQLHSSGYEPYKIPALLHHPSLVVANARGVTARAVAEHTLAMMFAFTRRLPQHQRNQVQHLWQRADSYNLLHKATVCIIGVGAIGSALAAMCHGIGMRVIGVQRSPVMLPCIDEIFPTHALQDALRLSRHVVVALPSLPLERPLFGAEEFNAMPSGSYLYSVSRASLVDYDALLAALDSGRLAGAGLDVFPQEPLSPASPLWQREAVLITPHAGGRFVGEMDALADLFADNLARYLGGKPLRNVVISKGTVSA